ncbi:MAG: sigma 54-interacting transcriptional regulator [Desulfomonilia bacterium]|jgi:transcriptional regulator with GAF, ATPase, and Fis domain|nr:sigma 54-interacting transcriptional regulator [Desulfomonilia bacterium]
MEIPFRLKIQSISSTAEDFRNKIAGSLELFVELLHIDQMTMTEFADEKGTLAVVESSHTPGVSPVRDISSDRMPWILNEILKGEMIILNPGQDTLPDGKYFLEKGVKSVVITPLILGRSIRGALFSFLLKGGQLFSSMKASQIKKIAENLMRIEASTRHAHELLSFEQLVSDISATYMNLPAPEIGGSIEYGLSRIGRFFRADRCALFQYSKESSEFMLSLMWADKGIKPLDRAALNHESFAYIFRKWSRGEAIRFTRQRDLPKSMSDLHDISVRSHLSVPFSVGGQISGAIVIETVNSYRTWQEQLVSRVKILGEIFGNALARKEKELELLNAYKEIKQLKKNVEADYHYLQEEIKLTHNFTEMIGQSKNLKRVFSDIEKVADTDTTVLILGETGTGKELVARAVHNASRRRSRPLVKVNCATLQPNLIENELFGHEKGAFTDARTRYAGKFELANGTTIFLDEIGELPLEIQPKLLRVLQDGEFDRLGGTRTMKTDARILAATNQDLNDQVRKGQFRQDFWYRLNVFTIHLPPLRDRIDDIPLLVEWFVRKYASKTGKKIRSIRSSSINRLKEYHWPGNIRELEHVIERAVIHHAHGSTLQIVDRLDQPPGEQRIISDMRTLAEIEHDHIMNVLEETNGRIHGEHGAAKILGLNPSTLRFRMKKLGIVKEAVNPYSSRP